MNGELHTTANDRQIDRQMVRKNYRWTQIA